ncbi:MAG: lysylphosphatidylglycerol synthase transmembrane domain-containing protein [bacterium]|nr:lysylphosphatidylglycerol synthase transmembrane domain-containing protein [bacterium]
MKSVQILKKYSFLIGVLLFIFILSRLNFGYYRQLLAGIRLSGILLIFSFIILLFLPSVALKAYRWQRLMKVQGIHYSFIQTFLMYQASVFIGMFTPARVGEASRVFYLKKDHSLGRSFVSIVLDRLFDMAFLLIFGYLSMFLFLGILKKEIVVFGIIVTALLLLIISIWKSRLLQLSLKKIFYYFAPQKHHDSLKLSFQDFFRDLKIYKFGDYAFSFFLTLIIWFAFYLLVYLFAREIGINIPFIYFSSAIAIASLIAFLPISIAGLGTRDAVLLVMFSFFKVPPELTIAVSMFILLLTIFISAIGLFCWFKKPLFRD